MRNYFFSHWDQGSKASLVRLPPQSCSYLLDLDGHRLLGVWADRVGAADPPPNCNSSEQS